MEGLKGIPPAVLTLLVEQKEREKLQESQEGSGRKLVL